MALIQDQQIREISYLSRDFDSIKLDLIDYIKRYFPNDYSDFNESSGGMAILELLAYIGDVLSFYTDRQVNEGFITRAVEEKNLFSMARSMGYKPKFEVPAVTEVSVTAYIPTSNSGDYLFKLNKGTRIVTDFEPTVSFEIVEDVDFSSTSNRAITTSGLETVISVSSVSAVAGQSRTFVYTVGDAIPFMKVTLPDEDITEVISITGNDGSEWMETDYLAQDTIFVGELNSTTTSGDVPYVLKLKRVPRRYVTEPETEGKLSVRFGSGVLTQEDSEVIPNPDDFVLPPTLRGAPSGFMPAIVDSTSFTKTKSLGVAPRNMALDIKYRFGGGFDTNVGPKTLNNFRNIDITWNNENIATVSADVTNDITAKLAVTNPGEASGGRDRESFDEVRENAAAYFSAQGRAVTLQDYQVRVLTMPTKFGTVFRSIARKDPTNNLGVELVIISKNADGYLVSTPATLKNNIETYINQFRSFSDSVKITDGVIIDIGVNFTVVPSRGTNNNEALLAAMFLLRNELDIANTNFNDQIVIPDLQSKMQQLPQILSVSELTFFNRTGTIDGRVYSSAQFDIDSNKLNGIISFGENMVWQCKYLDFDVIGTVV